MGSLRVAPVDEPPDPRVSSLAEAPRVGWDERCPGRDPSPLWTASGRLIAGLGVLLAAARGYVLGRALGVWLVGDSDRDIRLVTGLAVSASPSPAKELGCGGSTVLIIPDFMTDLLPASASDLPTQRYSTEHHFEDSAFPVGVAQRAQRRLARWISVCIH